jgi:integrase/recombinase XerC/integrase/recombinase XerD
MQAIIPIERAEAIPPAIRAEGLAELIDRFIGAQDITPASRETYRKALRQFVIWLLETGRAERLGTLSREDILAYKEHLQAAAKSSYTITCYLTAVRRLYDWLEAERVYPNIARGVKGAKKARGFRKDILAAGQLRAALEATSRDDLEGLRDYALFNLLARTGLRTIEIARAQVGDLRQESGQAVLWIQGKGRGSKDDFVLLMEDTLRPLRAYLSARGPLSEDAPLFCSGSSRNSGQGLTTRSIRRIIKQALLRVDLDSRRLSAHSLRHTAITLSLIGGATIQQAQAMARHSDPKTTLIYAHNLARVEAGAERFIDF